MFNTKYLNLISGLIILLSLFTNVQFLSAGPPFNTDDPEPVEYKHWEFYISSINTYNPGLSQGTLPHFEINYGVVPNVQLHLLTPLNFSFIRQSGLDFEHTFMYGYGYTELGVKYRFIQESKNMPQVGTFPLVEVPTVRKNDFNNGKVQIYVPIWIQKSWGKLTSYGGGGFWYNPGAGNRNWIFAGWELQYDLTKTLTLGGELFYHSSTVVAEQSGNKNNFFGVNAGGLLNFSEKFHFIFSFGHSFTGESSTISYAGVLWTI